MQPEFHYTRRDRTAVFEAICGTVANAQKFMAEFPVNSICGAHLDRVGDTLFFTVPLADLDVALLQIESAGYATVDIVGRDTSYEDDGKDLD